MKKFSAILLAVIMMLSMVAMAGTITIENTTDGTTYNVYKIFDATYTEGTTNVVYSYNGSNATLIANLKAETSPFDFDEATKNVVRKIGVEDADIIAWVKDNAANFGTAVDTIEGDGDAMTTDDLGNGYFYITSGLGTVVTIDSAVPNVTVVDKNEDGPTPPEKVIVGETDVSDNSVNIGDTVNFKITGTIARYDNDEAIDQYTFTDTMSDGLTLNADTVVVKVEGETKTAGTDYTINTTERGFTIVLTNKNENGFIYEVGAAYEITYTATLNANAVIDDANTNEIKLEWNNDEEIDTTTTKTYKIDVFKYTGNDEGLAGAGFVLKNDDGEYYKYDGTAVTWVESIDEATEYLTEADSYTVTFTGLAAGTYTVVEKTVPAGYNKAADEDYTITDASLTGATQVKVENKTGTELPETGGMGTTLFYVVGSLMMAAAVIVLVAKKKVAAK